MAMAASEWQLIAGGRMHSQPGAYVQTVLGPVPPEQLGPTMTHEHILSDLSPLERPPEEPGARELFEAPVSIENIGYLNWYYRPNADNLKLNDIATAIEELALYRQHGGGAIVEASSLGLSRDPAGLARVSKAAGVHVVMGSSFYVDASHAADMDFRSEDDIAAEIVRDLTVGVGSIGIRAGIIGEVGCSWPLTPNERKVLRASARAQRDTGAAILIHPGRDESSPDEILDVLEDAGGDLTRTILGHLDRTVLDRAMLLRLARRGIYLEWDHFGFERSWYPPNLKVDMPSNAGRMDYLAFMIEAGYGEKLVIAHDIASKVRLSRYGGHGYRYVIAFIVPRMRERGFSEVDIQRILVTNPAAVLTFETKQA